MIWRRAEEHMQWEWMRFQHEKVLVNLRVALGKAHFEEVRAIRGHGGRCPTGVAWKDQRNGPRRR